MHDSTTFGRRLCAALSAVLVYLALCPCALVADNNTNIRVLERNARSGNAEAMNKLGVAYYSGNNVDRDYDKAFYWWSQGALRQNPKAIANLGVCYQYGRGVATDSVTAMRLYMHAISLGQTELLAQRSRNVDTNPFDAMLVAQCYDRGVGTPSDPRQALATYLVAADNGSVDGMLMAADALLAQSQPARALDYYRRAAAAGSVRAQYMAGRMLAGGMGVPSDRTRAIDLLRRAAAGGDADACDMLGMMYLKGDGVPRSGADALRWLRQSAATGSAQGMWDLATALSDDQSPLADFEGAVFWFGEAAQAGRGADFARMLNSLPASSPFRSYVSGLKCYMLDGDYSKAMSYFKRLDRAKGVADEGRVMQARLLADPSNPSGDRRKAMQMLQKVTGSNHADVVLAAMYLEGGRAEATKALNLLRRAATNGHGVAQNMLADEYYTGRNAMQDRATAASLYIDALAQRQLDAQGRDRLLDMYDAGELDGRMDAATAEALRRYTPRPNVADMLRDTF